MHDRRRGGAPRAHHHLLTVVTVMVVVLMLALPDAAASTVHRFALIMGNNQGAPGSPLLRHADQDARRIKDVLSELGEVPREQIVLLNDAGVGEVRRALNNLEERFEAVRRSENDRVIFIIYYSGHGTAEYLELGETRLPLIELRDRIQHSGATLALAILDACHSGAFIRAKGGHRAPSFPLPIDQQLLSEGFAVLASSSMSERSQESDEVRGSFFTHYLVSGLRGAADYSGDGLVTLSEAYMFTYHQTVVRSTASGGGPQHPHFDYDLSGAGDLVLTRLEHANATIEFPSGSNGSFMLVAPGSGSVVAELPLDGQTARRLAVRAGEYTLFDLTDRQILSQDITVAEGGVHRVDIAALNPVTAANFRGKGPIVAMVRRDERPATTLSLSPKFGFQGIMNSSIRQELLAPALLFGLEATWERVGIDNLSLTTDLLASYGTQQMRFSDELGDRTPGSQRMFQLNFGLTALYSLRWGPLTAGVGPRVAGLYLRREVDGEFAMQGSKRSDQDAFTITPQGVARLTYRPLDWLVMSLEGRVGYLRLTLDSRSHHLGYGEAFVMLGLTPSSI